jgi:hypothetical protein
MMLIPSRTLPNAVIAPKGRADAQQSSHSARNQEAVASRSNTTE